MGIKEHLSLYHETFGSLGKGNHRISLIVDKMERFKVGFDDEKVIKFCSIVNWSNFPVRLLIDNVEWVKLKTSLRFFHNILVFTLRMTSLLLWSPRSFIEGDIEK